MKVPMDIEDHDGSDISVDVPIHKLSNDGLRDLLRDISFSEKFTRLYFKSSRARNRDRRATDRTVRRIWLQLKRRGEVK